MQLSDFPITEAWPPKQPDQLQLYSLGTPNGLKVSTLLEEIGMDYELHKINFGTNDQKSPGYLSLNPNGKIPAILDPDGPGGAPYGLWESGAILIYLAEKSGKFLSTDPKKRMTTLQWLMFQMGGAGPMFGQFGFFFKMGGAEWEDKRPLERYQSETVRLLGVVEHALSENQYVAGEDYSIADIALFPWLGTLIGFYGAGKALEFDTAFPKTKAWLDLCRKRPAAKAALASYA